MDIDDEHIKHMERLYGWVGPGLPDLDDEEERDRFMRDVIEASYHFQHLLWEHEQK